MDWRKELAEAIRSVLRPHSEGALTNLAEVLSPSETWPKFVVWEDHDGTFDASYWKWESPSKITGHYANGNSFEPCGIFNMRNKSEVTEAEAKAHVRPEPPKGKRLTGEFRVPTHEDTYLGHYHNQVILPKHWVHGADENFNNGKRWILEDDDTCPACHGKGTV